MVEVRRAEDAELCGFIDADAGVWRALTVFGGVLGEHDSEDDARRQVLDVALASLADRWVLIDGTSGDEQAVCIQEVSPYQVTVALGYYSLLGVPSLTITRDDVVGGRWRLRRR